jgi:hypothetical protein
MASGREQPLALMAASLPFAKVQNDPTSLFSVV